MKAHSLKVLYVEPAQQEKNLSHLSYMSKKVSHKLDLEIKDQFGLNYHILEKG